MRYIYLLYFPRTGFHFHQIDQIDVRMIYFNKREDKASCVCVCFCLGAYQVRVRVCRGGVFLSEYIHFK